jgi:hypothetical protein
MGPHCQQPAAHSDDCRTYYFKDTDHPSLSFPTSSYSPCYHRHRHLLLASFPFSTGPRTMDLLIVTFATSSWKSMEQAKQERQPTYTNVTCIRLYKNTAYTSCFTLSGSLVTNGMARLQLADRGDGLQIWRVAENMLNKQSRTADSGWSSSLGVGRGAKTPSQ